MKKFLESFLYALRGLRIAIIEQRNLKIQIVVAFMTAGAGLYFQVTDIEWCVLLLTMALVIGLEMMNSAVENLVDLVTREQHPLAGKVKDIAAGAVLFASTSAVIIGVVIFAKYLFSSATTNP